MDYLESEKLKYSKIWEINDYRVNSPSENELGFILDRIITPKEGTSILDMGCGTGRTGVELHKVGFRVNLYDITENSLDEEVRDYTKLNDNIEFKEIDDLSYKAKKKSKWAICFDVMEHIPEEQLDSVIMFLINNTSKGVVFQISTREDDFGKRIGETLHLTVKHTAWWISLLSEYGVVSNMKSNSDSVILLLNNFKV
jgi:2-polyprenyl-3-methyl-5-hydroxy-6-metoxy-1,4-benzoquinol methylase